MVIPSYKVEGFANLPLGDKTAVRLVAWSDQQGGYINNIAKTFTYAFPNVTGAWQISRRSSSPAMRLRRCVPRLLRTDAPLVNWPHCISLWERRSRSGAVPRGLRVLASWQFAAQRRIALQRE